MYFAYLWLTHYRTSLDFLVCIISICIFFLIITKTCISGWVLLKMYWFIVVYLVLNNLCSVTKSQCCITDNMLFWSIFLVITTSVKIYIKYYSLYLHVLFCCLHIICRFWQTCTINIFNADIIKYNNSPKHFVSNLHYLQRLIYLSLYYFCNVLGPKYK